MNAVLEIKADAVIHNLTYFKSKLHSSTKTLAVVKAFGYGSDAVILSRILQKSKVDYLAVAYIEEGIHLRKEGIRLPILVLHPQSNNLSELIEYHLEPNIYSKKMLIEFLKLAKKQKLVDYPVHLKFNTGLNRLGFHKDEVTNIITIINKEKLIKIQSVFSHLAESDDVSDKRFTLEQINAFIKIKNEVTSLLNYKPIFHLLNTSGIINYPEAQFDMVRLGIGIYGFGNDIKITNKLQNVLTLKSVISQIHTIKKGESVGYNRAFIAESDMKTATISIGHADGISRKLGNNNGYVLVNKKKAFIIGNVCMDMIMVDITTIRCKEGDEVVLFNSQKMIEEIAIKINTIPYEFLTMISQRVKRKII